MSCKKEKKAARTPDHIKKKVIELLYLWSTKELKGETKIGEAYTMLKKQGIIQEDPVYVGDAVFASALPPRKSAALSDEESQKLRRLLQSKSPDDLQMANKIIKGMVHEDERKMDALTKRSTELIMVNNNAKLLAEILDHYDQKSCGGEEKQLLYELFQSCEKMQPKLFRLAADTEDDDETSLAKILQASDDINKVIDRYKMVVIQGKPDILKNTSYQHQTPSSADQLLDLNEVKTSKPDSEFLVSLDFSQEESIEELKPEPEQVVLSQAAKVDKIEESCHHDLLDSADDEALKLSESAMPIIPLNPGNSASGFTQDNQSGQMAIFDEKSSRQKGLEELDLLGESLLKQHLPDRPCSNQFKNEKIPLNVLQKKKKEQDLVVVDPAGPVQGSKVLAPKSTTSAFGSTASAYTKASEPLSTASVLITTVSAPGSAPGSASATSLPELTVPVSGAKASSLPTPIPNGNEVTSLEAVKLADLNVPISSIKPSPAIPPLTLQESDDGISIVLHFGKDQPREHVSAIVVTVINKLPEAISDYELKAVVPRGCKVKIQDPTTTSLPAHNPFVPASAITQVMLIANPTKKDPLSFKYIVSYSVDGEPQTEMGQVDRLPI